MEDGPSKRPADEVSPDAAGNEDKKGDDIVEKDAIMIDETTPSSVAAETPMAEPVEIRSSNPVPEPVTKSGNLPSRPIKKARTAYFIFADEKRPEIQARHPGEGVGSIARETGQLWAKLDEAGRAEYHIQSARERERVSQELAKYSLDGLDLGLPPTAVQDLTTLIFPLARLRKITKLDPDVKGVSKEGLLLITKCAEMVTAKLGQESVKVAQLQNRRKLLPEDVAQVCATREQFLFLREDVKDLLREQLLDTKRTVGKKKEAVTTSTTTTSNLFKDFFANSSGT